MTVTWSDGIDVIIGGDLVVALGYRTRAGGVVVQAVAPVGLRDRERGTLGFTTSLGFSKKLERIAADPRVALAFHTRRHGTALTSEYVLAQGTARVIEKPSAAERERVRTNATAHLGPPKQGVFWDRWLREYYQVRVPVDVGVQRLIIWPQLDAAGPPTVSGDPFPDHAPEPQRPPRNGTAPRIDVARAARRLRATEHTLLGFAGADGSPIVIPVAIGRDDPSGIILTSAVELPPGGRRAGLLGHSFKPQLIGLEARQHTGWMEVAADRSIRYAPHTETGYKAPANKTLLLLLNGALAKQGVRKARKAGAAGI
ncbi:MAG TPA: pyridoxamine 5'-phosphate oxidase family protein [Solirubrobacteraceae bacterium]|nr:pyridoxamine 5'-phosphate oxidase family protein [Solirubrobacteraceae bacterium]